MTRNIKEIAPLLAEQFIDIETDLTEFDNNDKLIQANANRIGGLSKYLGKLHDSWFISTTLNNGTFSITLNDFTTHVFSDVLVDKNNLQIGHDRLVFPIELDFETTELSFNTVDDDGNIHPVEPIIPDEYLNEQIISVNSDEIEIGIVVWKIGTKKKPGQGILILMKAKNISVRELQDKAWFEIFGNTYDHLYNYFKAQLATGRYLSDQSVCNELYYEFERE